MNEVRLEGQLSALREREIRLLHEVGDVLRRVSPEGESDRDRLRDVADDLRRMFFLVVVVGEFNAGKSTFINALLGDELLPTGITPTTEVIELIRYAEQPERKPVLREDGVREWAHPNTGGPGVVLVDTPGTGSVFQKHEQTARNFLHRSDLVVFVMSAKRAFAETERLYLELIRDFGKKVVIVVNQADLLEAREQAEVRRFVQEQAENLLGLKPLIFMASAKRALGGETDAGMDGARAHLWATFAQIPPAQQKLMAQLDFTERLMATYRGRLDGRLDVIGRDSDQAGQIQRELETRAGGLESNLGASSGEVARILGGVRDRGEVFINQNFTIRRPRRSSDREALQADFETQVIGRSLDQIADLANDYVNGLVDGTRRYWGGIIARLNKLDTVLDQAVGGVDSGVYAEQRGALQEAIALADAEMAGYSNATVLREMQNKFDADMSGFWNSAALGSVGALAAIIGIATPGAIVAHPLALIGLVIGAPVTVVGGVAAFRYWRRLRNDIKRDFADRLDTLERSYKGAMAEMTDRERNRLLGYGRGILEPVFSRFQVMRESADRDLAAMDGLAAEVASLREQITAIETIIDS